MVEKRIDVLRGEDKRAMQPLTEMKQRDERGWLTGVQMKREISYPKSCCEWDLAEKTKDSSIYEYPV